VHTSIFKHVQQQDGRMRNMIPILFLKNEHKIDCNSEKKTFLRAYEVSLKKVFKSSY